MRFRDYETMYIVTPDLGGESIRALAAKYLELINELGGDVTSVEDWGQRRFAYEIDDYTEGHYLIMQFSGNEEITQELDRRMKLDDNIIRMMTVRQGD
ncbi:MAG: 30S ribosomal protein S6 [Bacillota bacterium]